MPDTGGAESFVVRGGYGLFAEALGNYARAQGSGPYQLSETFYNSIQNGQALFAFPNPFPAGAGSIPSQSVTGFDPDTRNGQIHQFNLTVERQIRDIGLQLSYVGSRSRNLNYNIGINLPQPSLTPFAQTRRPYPQFVGITFARTNGAANYNAMILEGKRRFGQFTFDAHWTWASNYENTNNLENPYAPLTWSRDPSTFHHRVALVASWKLPVGRGHRWLPSIPGPLDQVLGGWQLYWITYLETRQYFSPSFSGSDPSNTNTTSGLPDRIANGNLPSNQRTVNHWFDASAFAVPAKGSFGNSGAYVLQGPGRQTHDVTLGKSFRVHERLNFAVMAVAQNVMNHPVFNNPAANISIPATVGVISSTKGYTGPRTMVLWLTMDF